MNCKVYKRNNQKLLDATTMWNKRRAMKESVWFLYVYNIQSFQSKGLLQTSQAALSIWQTICWISNQIKYSWTYSNKIQAFFMSSFRKTSSEVRSSHYERAVFNLPTKLKHSHVCTTLISNLVSIFDRQFFVTETIFQKEIIAATILCKSPTSKGKL